MASSRSTLPPDEKISLNKSPPTPAPSRFRRHLNKAKLQIPIDHRRSPAGSCMGGFRTPAPCPDARPVMAGIRKPSPCRSYERVAEYLESGRSRPGHTGPHMPAPLASSQLRTMMPMAPAVKAWIAGGFGIAAVSRLPPNSPAPMDDKFQCDFSSFEGSAPARFCAER